MKDKPGKKKMYVGSIITSGQKGHQEYGKHSPEASVHRRPYKRNGFMYTAVTNKLFWKGTIVPGRGPYIEGKLGEKMRTPVNTLGASSPCRDGGDIGEVENPAQAGVNTRLSKYDYNTVMTKNTLGMAPSCRDSASPEFKEGEGRRER